MSILSNNKIYKKSIISNSKKILNNKLPLFSDILSIPSNPEDIFTLINPIGHGAFGSVYKAIHNKTKKVYAIKIIQYFKDEHILLSNIKHMENINFCYKTVQEETSLMRLVNSSNYIVKYYGSYFSRITNTLWLILEYCASGSVIDLMLAMDRTYTEIEIATIIKMVLKGLIIIHEKNLIHRDVKGANILLSGDGYAKIGDFGVGVQLQEDFRKSKKGSPYWMSPQVVNNEGYGIGTDIWSLGVTCLELYNGEPPHSSLKPGEVMEKIAKCEVNFEELFENKNMSECFKNFVKKCLVVDEKKRAMAKDLINDEFIMKYSKDNKLLEELYKQHINELDEYRREVEEYEQEMKQKQKKEYEDRKIIQQQKEKQNMSIEVDIEENKEEINCDNNKYSEEEMLFDKSINSLFFNTTNDINQVEEKDEKEKINNDIINTKSSDDDIRYFENNYKNKFESPNDVFGLDHQISVKERYNDNDSNNMNLNKINHLSSDMVNLSSNLCMKNNLINKSIDIKGYALESNLTNKTCDQIMMNTQKNSRKKNKIKCRIININKSMISRQKNNFINDKILSKTMENKRICSFDINKNLILSYSNTNKKDQDNRKSMNLINNIKSLSILSNNKVLQNKGNIGIYRPFKTEENNDETKSSSIKNITAKSAKFKPLKSKEIKDNKSIRISTHSNTNDNSNSRGNSNFNTNNNTISKLSNNLNSSNSVYTKKIYSQNFIIMNKDNNISHNVHNITKGKIPFSNKGNKSFRDKDNNIMDKKKCIQKDIKNIEIKDKENYYNNKEDINDSDDDGIINKVKNLENENDDYFKENKENIVINKIIENYNKNNDKSTITNNSNHSYSVIESNEYTPSINKNNIFSFAHKKYFS